MTKGTLGFQLIGMKGGIGFSKLSYQCAKVGFREDIDFYHIVGQDSSVEAAAIYDFSDFLLHSSEVDYSLQENWRRFGLPWCSGGDSWPAGRVRMDGGGGGIGDIQSSVML